MDDQKNERRTESSMGDDDSRVRIAEVVEPDSSLPRDLLALRHFAFLLDAAIPIPGSRRRIGLSPLIGLAPGFGDAIGALLGTWVLFGALRHRVPRHKVVRMIANIVIDLVIGAIPVIGDVFDFLFSENLANVDILLRYRDRSRPPRSTWKILSSAILIVLAVAALAISVAIAVIALLVKLLHGILIV